jgi:hypothetical protein
MPLHIRSVGAALVCAGTASAEFVANTWTDSCNGLSTCCMHVAPVASCRALIINFFLVILNDIEHLISFNLICFQHNKNASTGESSALLLV